MPEVFAVCTGTALFSGRVGLLFRAPACIIDIRREGEENAMKKLKKFGIICVVIMVAAGIFGGWYFFRTWPLRFHSELDRFFGEGNWELLSEDTQESLIYKEYVTVRSNPGLSGERAGKFHDWQIGFTNRDGEKEMWEITDHTMKINHDEHWIFSPQRYSAKQALVLELMDISFAMAGEEVYRDVIGETLRGPEAECIEVSISYRNGNPEPGFYDELWKEPWFTADQITAGDYLECDLHDFYIDVFAYDYRVEKLTEEQRRHMMDSYDDIERALQEKYGENADYEIFFDEEHCTEHYGG